MADRDALKKKQEKYDKHLKEKVEREKEQAEEERSNAIGFVRAAISDNKLNVLLWKINKGKNKKKKKKVKKLPLPKNGASSATSSG